jgi:hypothetical protein
MISPCCLWFCVSSLSTFEYLKQSLWNFVCISWHLNPSQRFASQILPISLCLCLYPLSLLGNGSVNTFPRQRIQEKIVGRVFLYTIVVVTKEGLWVCLCIPNFSVCSVEAVVWSLPKPWNSNIGSWVPWDSEFKITVTTRTSSNLLDSTVYPCIVARQQFGKRFPAATKNCWRRHFLCGLRHIKGKQTISSLF